VTAQPFAEALPPILEDRGITLRALARDVGGLDHAYLSRMLSGKTSVNVRHVEAISRYLRLPVDYFPEVREARTIQAVRKSGRLRDEIYFTRVATRRRR
jgi:transcriptional regulator with XRE-family HTH domain